MTSSTADLEVFRLSAEGCGHPAEVDEGGTTWIHRINARSIGGRQVRSGGIRWNPFTNDSQRWECVEKLLEEGGTLILSDECDPCVGDRAHEWYRGTNETLQSVILQCPASEFPARALAELQRRKA